MFVVRPLVPIGGSACKTRGGHGLCATTSNGVPRLYMTHESNLCRLSIPSSFLSTSVSTASSSSSIVAVAPADSEDEMGFLDYPWSFRSTFGHILSTHLSPALCIHQRYQLIYTITNNSHIYQIKLGSVTEQSTGKQPSSSSISTSAPPSSSSSSSSLFDQARMIGKVRSPSLRVLSMAYDPLGDSIMIIDQSSGDIITMHIPLLLAAVGESPFRVVFTKANGLYPRALTIHDTTGRLVVITLDGRIWDSHATSPSSQSHDAPSSLSMFDALDSADLTWS
jgi:hypothetical protein